MEPDYDFYPDTSEFDEVVEGFKEKLRESVAKEIKEELEALRKENKDLKAVTRDLDKLQFEAELSKRTYDSKLQTAKREAEYLVRRESAGELLSVLKEPRYTIKSSRVLGPKCGNCGEERKIHYTTPSGRKSWEFCACYVHYSVYSVEEVLVCEASKRDGKLIVWYRSVPSSSRSDGDYVSPTILKSPKDVPLKDMLKYPYEYGFSSLEEAEAFAETATAYTQAEEKKQDAETQP